MTQEESENRWIKIPDGSERPSMRVYCPLCEKYFDRDLAGASGILMFPDGKKNPPIKAILMKTMKCPECGRTIW